FAVHLSGVDERHPQLDPALERRNLLRATLRAVADIPGPEPERRNLAPRRQCDFFDHYLAGQTDQGENPIVISLPSTQNRSSRLWSKLTVPITPLPQARLLVTSNDAISAFGLLGPQSSRNLL